ncbi:MAG: FeoB-associated Cys-rich membrane protein [Oscillospiraceae bacterium]|nr:FeoB-associated Cys-rich membrane protein [Oscillospiraceae bacterium]
MPTIITLAVLAAIVILIILKLRKDKKNGISLCGGKCGNCPNSDFCHGNSANNTKGSE